MDKEYTSGCVCLGTVEGGAMSMNWRKTRECSGLGGRICTLITKGGKVLVKVMVDEHKQDDNGGNG